MEKIGDLTGETFGDWKIIEKDGNKNRNIYWLCKCKNCGEIKSKRGINLLQGIGLNCCCLTEKPYKHKESLEKLIEKYSDSEIGKMFNVKRETIKYFRTKYELPPCPIRDSKRPNKYTLNKQFFKEINNEFQAYILGFICADGYVHKNGKVVSIAIKQSDKQILENIKGVMETNAELRVKKKPSNQEDLLVLNISSCELVNDLATLGITPNKSKIINLPLIKTHLYKHFFRGLFDGDGYIGERQFTLTSGSIYILTRLREIVQKETKQKLTLRELKKDGYIRGYQLYGGKKNKDVLDWAYSNSKISLERKYRRYIKFWT
ncbi:hypothetical protein J2Y03_000060 [Neobacillus niacini]|uniref:LAGLIDADG family homing endonuclease n=1 Tax=Neobacillus niacini TaxID=86668 RepID=UPI0028648638|nr:LAGLIDADG family homing endonuclease [Neobacillus niacini]MDR7075072.1 hypothetical protein [Neobacillus niacini]